MKAASIGLNAASRTSRRCRNHTFRSTSAVRPMRRSRRRSARRCLRAVGRDPRTGARHHRARACGRRQARTSAAIQPVAAPDPCRHRGEGLGAGRRNPRAGQGDPGEEPARCRPSGGASVGSQRLLAAAEQARARQTAPSWFFARISLDPLEDCVGPRPGLLLGVGKDRAQRQAESRLTSVPGGGRTHARDGVAHLCVGLSHSA